MTEERSCEEAPLFADVEAFNVWAAWCDEQPPMMYKSKVLSMRAFAAGAAWARTPTLPAGADPEYSDESGRASERVRDAD